MQKLLLGIGVGILLSLAWAQSPGFGVYSGYPEWIGVQYQDGSSNLRFGLGFGSDGLGGSADLFLGKMPLPATGIDLAWYYGLGARLGLSSEGKILVFPHGLVGVEWAGPAPGFKVYLEAQAGVSITGAGVNPGFAGRLGVIFR
ncbi:MAG: hypothetical protein C4301_04265 [Thermus sp.]|uniref:hypothetical protein n=1 Tax=Thermus sp. TaxID=275 RepID=UPI003327E597